MLSSDKAIYPERLVTGYYGQLTVSAVKRFQAKHNLETTGLVNIQTKDKLNEIYGKTPQTSSSIKTTALTEAQKQILIKQLQETIKKLLEQLLQLLKEKAGR
ncbi:MAG: peptidoglycan-binding domain-containing protein [Patescibacteria group bacterium]